MISAYQAGLAAGSTFSFHHPELTLEEQEIAAHEEITKRRELGIAHLVPEEEFVKGFLDGCKHHSIPDGLTLYSMQRAETDRSLP